MSYPPPQQPDLQPQTQQPVPTAPPGQAYEVSAPPAGGIVQGPGYPTPSQGYPPSSQGYPPSNQGYPPPNQGYPPPNQVPAAYGEQQNGNQQQFAAWQPNTATEGGPSYDGGDTPDSDAEDDENAVPAEVPPPDLNNLQPPPGYAAIMTQGALLPPVASAPDEDKKPPETFAGVGTINEQQVREAICAYAEAKCCYGTGPAEDMKFDKLDASGALHYKLETFTETRTTEWGSLPYSGGQLDGPNCGQSPAVWDMVCPANSNFETHKKVLEVPHTSSVKQCHGCAGLGFRRCHRCYGRGQVRCSTCHGNGRRSVFRDGERHEESCNFCHGSGRRRCYTCGGDGRVTCPTCIGFRQVRWYIALTVQFTNNVEDFIHETTDMPDELVREVGGDVVFEQTLPYVWPITQYHMREINENSVAIVNRHRTNWPDSRLLQQRQNLRSVPVTEVKYTFKEEGGRFWIYGNEHEVHCPEYPAKVCWGCTIL